MIAEDVEIIAATRLSEQEFMAKAPLASSLGRLRTDRKIRSRIFSDNRTALPIIYNQAIESAAAPDIVIMIHDDVWIEEIFLAERLTEALASFDVVGVAGNRRRVPRQVKWHMLPSAQGVFDFPNLSGRLSHFRPLGRISRYGDVPAPCELLDGVFLAVRRSTLQRVGIRFDPRFDFHFYDMDFCRMARAQGLTLGTWPIAISHRSTGSFDSEPWNQKRDLYLEKWPD